MDALRTFYGISLNFHGLVHIRLAVPPHINYTAELRPGIEGQATAKNAIHWVFNKLKILK